MTQQSIRSFEVPEFSERCGFPVYVRTLEQAFAVALATGCDTVHEWRESPAIEPRLVRRWWGCRIGHPRAEVAR